MEESFVQVYSKGIKKLENINNSMVLKYENYYKIKTKYKLLKKKSENFVESDIDQLVLLSLDLLNDIKTSTSIDYEEERILVEEIYHLIYKIVKIESLSGKNSTLLETIKNDSIDISYITNLIRKDIENISDPNKKEQIISKIEEIESCGLNDLYFLDKDLIILLTPPTEIKNEVEEQFLNDLMSYEKNYRDLELERSDIKVMSDKLLELKKLNKKMNLKIIRKKILFIINIGILSASLLFSFRFSKDKTKGKVYETVTKTYDTASLESTIEIEYLPSCNNECSLIEYSPWENPGYFRDGYKRNVYTYDLSCIEKYYDNIEDYLNSDLKDLVVFTEVVETSTEIPMEEYTENKYEIKQVVQDKTKFEIVDRPTIQVLYFFWLMAIYGVIDFLAVSSFKKEKLKDLRVQKSNTKKKIKENREKLLEMEESINESIENLLVFKDQLIEEYYKLPSIIQENQKVKKKILTLENNLYFEKESQ